MEVLPVLKNEGAIYALTTTPVVIDLGSHTGSYLRLSSLVADDAAYVCGIAAPGDTPTIAATTAHADHGTANVPNVAEPIALGPTGSHRVPQRSHRYLWVRTITGTATLHVKPAGRPGEWGN